MTARSIKLLATGKYLPKQIITSTFLDEKLNKPTGWVERKSGVKQRHFANGETAAQMAAKAATQAIANADLNLENIECLVSAGGTMEQAIPYTGALIKEQLGLADNPLPAFDINTTCLSFITALDTLSYLVDAQRYRTVLIVSSDIASVGLNWHDPESCTLFGDGAAAAVIAPTPLGESSKILTARLETYSQGAHLCEIRAGGSHYHPITYPNQMIPAPDYLFDMKGKALYKLVAAVMPGFMERLLSEAKLSLADITLIIPHQASQLAMHHLQHFFKLPAHQLMDIYAYHGNQIAASIPTALHEAITQKRIQRGDIIMLIGTSAGVSVGGLILEY